MNQWIWIIAIFVSAFCILLFLRRQPSSIATEGFGNLADANVQFADKQYNFFHKLMNRGLFLNNGINLSELNTSIGVNNLYNTIPETNDYTQYFSPDPYKEYFDYDATFCKPARHPRNLPNREPVKRTQCGWWYVPDPSIPSVGVLGTREEPIVREGLPANGTWIWDLQRAIEMEDKKMCKRIKSCDVMDIEGIQGNCGFCERLGHAVPMNRNGSEKYPESNDACGQALVTNSNECYKEPPRDLVTDDGIHCGSYGRASSDGSLRLYTKQECDALNGNYAPNGECLVKTGGSYSAACSALNTPDAIPSLKRRAVCEPDARGNLTRECLISLVKGLGYNQSGGIMRMLLSSTGPNETDKYAIDVLQKAGIAVPDALLGAGNIDKTSAAKLYSDIYNAMTSGFVNLTKQAAKWLVSGTDSFDICEFESSKTGPFPLTCIQREFRQAGCQPAGAAHPTSSNSASIQAMTWGSIRNKFKELHASMKSTDSEIQRKATKDCLGIDFYRGSDSECCYIMYGSKVGFPGKVDRIETLLDGQRVYLKQDGAQTKLVHQNGECRYYVGRIEQFNRSQYGSYALVPRGTYVIRKGTPQECNK
jgi:hypothetical protein